MAHVTKLGLELHPAIVPVIYEGSSTPQASTNDHLSALSFATIAAH